MNKLLLHKGNVKRIYNIHEYDDEVELEKMVVEHFKEIFGEQAMFFDARRIQTSAGIKAKTDGFIISLDEKKWYILEVELSRHRLYDHIVPQISKFNQAHKSYENRKKMVEAFYVDINDSSEKTKMVRSGGIKEAHKFLTELIDSRPVVVIVIDNITEELEEVCESLPLKSKVIEFKTFIREDTGLLDHIHLFEPLVKKPEKKIITLQKEYRIPILESLIEMGGKGKMNRILERLKGKMKDKLTAKDWEMLQSGTAIRWKNAAQWERQKMKEEGLLRADSPRGIWEITKKGENYYHSQK